MAQYAERSPQLTQRGTNHFLLDLPKAGAEYISVHNDRQGAKSLIRFCRKDEIDDILALQTRVYNSIKSKETFVMTTAEELAESLQVDVCIGAYHYGRIVSFTLMITYPFSSRNLGWHLGYTQEQCSKCVTYDTTFVDPSYQGHGLQRMFIKLKDKIAMNMGALEALATVSPCNNHSLRNMEANGFKITARKPMYGDYDRLILRKQLKSQMTGKAIL
jgi:GNAT superfamily N-acetyltransferase